MKKPKHLLAAALSVGLLCQLGCIATHNRLHALGTRIGLPLDSHLGPAPEILPGWSLRRNLTTDGRGYDLMLEDLTDQSCGYAVVSDEPGII